MSSQHRRQLLKARLLGCIATTLTHTHKSSSSVANSVLGSNYARRSQTKKKRSLCLCVWLVAKCVSRTFSSWLFRFSPSCQVDRQLLFLPHFGHHSIWGRKACFNVCVYGFFRVAAESEGAPFGGHRSLSFTCEVFPLPEAYNKRRLNRLICPPPFFFLLWKWRAKNEGKCVNLRWSGEVTFISQMARQIDAPMGLFCPRQNKKWESCCIRMVWSTRSGRRRHHL